MIETSRITLLALTAFSAAAFATPAGACTRPLAPTEPTATATSTSAITVTWRNNAKIGEYGGYMHAEISVRRAGYPNDYSLDKTGMRHAQGPGTVGTYGFTGLNPGVQYCFNMWARTEAVNGCRSPSSNVVCATTLREGAPLPPPARPVWTLGKVIIFTVHAEPNNVFRVVGKNFLRAQPVTIRVADAALKNIFITDIGTSRITSDARGGIDVKLSGLCQKPGTLYFSGTDGRKDKKDLTGTLWSGTKTATCR